MKKNLEKIQQNISALLKTHSHLSHPTVIAVSKKQNLETIRKAYVLGVRDFGENYWQETEYKIENLADLDIRWHFIGSLQSKKIKDIVGSVNLIHTVYREVELKKISEAAQAKQVVQDILIQVNIANEASKSGLPPANFLEMCQHAQSLQGVRLRGLMIFPPLESDKEKARAWFQAGATLFQEAQKKWNTLDTLSMGTSSDYLEALACGATHLRIGESLLGKRLDPSHLQS